MQQERWKDMNITDIRLRKVGDESKLRAVASITFDDEFVVHDIKVIEGQKCFISAWVTHSARIPKMRLVAVSV